MYQIPCSKYGGSDYVWCQEDPRTLSTDEKRRRCGMQSFVPDPQAAVDVEPSKNGTPSPTAENFDRLAKGEE